MSSITRLAIFILSMFNHLDKNNSDNNKKNSFRFLFNYMFNLFIQIKLNKLINKTNKYKYHLRYLDHVVKHCFYSFHD